MARIIAVPHVVGALGAIALVSLVGAAPRQAGAGSPVDLPGRGIPAARQPRADSAAVARTVERFHRALAEGDSAAALAMLAPDATILESGGVESLPEYRAHHLLADIEFARAVQAERSPIRVTIRGDAAWATSTTSTRGEFKGRPVDSTGAELMVLTRMPGGWRIAAVHWSSRRRSS